LPGYRLWEWVRHHTTAVLSTIVDYAVMIACVELAHLSPVPATAIGATVGAVTNFLINRSFTYLRATDRRVPRQLGRFVFVSAMSLVLNTGGEHLFHYVIGLQYLVARVIVSTIVSNAWNYPMLRFFVFSTKPPEGA
jgi:putative flippase GtrA